MKPLACEVCGSLDAVECNDLEETTANGVNKRWRTFHPVPGAYWRCPDHPRQCILYSNYEKEKYHDGYLVKPRSGLLR